MTVQYGLTIETSRFNFAKVDVGITMPCYAEEVDDCYRAVSQKVAGLIKAERDAILGEEEQEQEKENF